ncbi:MAG: HRDC domain-containing protein [Pirellulales bacterium]|nr:HRDC domain-containing protein [Pirellulales bacterium]
MRYETITTDAHLRQLCDRLAHAPQICFDTEFVSEHTYRPQLCLVQVAAGEMLAVIDPLAIDDLRPFWQVIAAPGHETVVHAGREELWFCLESSGHRPRDLFDVQLAAGLIGLEYPAGYGNLLYRLLGKQAQKGETRTDWRRRPLTERQLEYALDDVRYLAALRDTIGRRLEKLSRASWLADEMIRWQNDVEASRNHDRWRKVAGSSNLSGRSLAIVRELWKWREAESQRRNRPPRTVLRDDLIVELAKRRLADVKQIRAVRGFERPDLQRVLGDLARTIELALALPDGEIPRLPRREVSQQLVMVGQFLTAALTSICRQAEVAPSLVGTVDDVRELITYRLEGDPSLPTPSLIQGWRAEVVGHQLDELLFGKMAIRIQDPLAEQPLSFVRLNEQ